jgi:hypothetical protein
VQGRARNTLPDDYSRMLMLTSPIAEETTPPPRLHCSEIRKQTPPMAVSMENMFT